ncbi:MAG: 2-succinyl-5-enolpyruvyl-6-hydroxy-3-cyclohexene-1-carboxylic-acid synthase [Solirubrobacteraceae bacterium]
MPAGPDTHLLLRAFVDELARCGVREACTSPGSRSTPIVLALVRETRLRCFSHIDERCSGFFAVGAAKAACRPVAITCTSGTAAANLAPAVIEAFQARVPLVVLTADRPPELREVGAGQTIDQISLYGSAAKWFFEVGTHEATAERLRWMRTLACRAVWTALEGRPGPVHLNFALREPLVPPADLGADPLPGRGAGRPWLVRGDSERPGAAAAGRALAVMARDAQRPVVVAGRAEPGLDAIGGACQSLGWPLLADPLSGARRGGAAIAHYDLLLRASAFTDAHPPDLVLRCGDLPTSKPLRAWLEGLDQDVPQLAFDPQSARQDPPGSLHVVLSSDAAMTLVAAAEHAPAADPAWLSAWRDADQRAAAAVDALLSDELSEPRTAREVGAGMPPEATLFVASSMPVRDVESFTAVRSDAPRVLCNRGANGIDGTLSSAFGAAAVSDGPVVLLVGDVALAHDIGGLLAARRCGLSLTIILLSNDGGGIFDFLPVACEHDAFEEHIATPHGLHFAHAAALYGCAHEHVGTVEELRDGLDRAIAAPATTILEVSTRRAANLALHRELAACVLAAI